MRAAGRSKWLFPGILAILTFLADFSSKAWANSHLSIGQTTPFIPGLLRLTLTRNTGSAFGIGRGHGLIMGLLALSIIAFLIFWIWKKEKSGTPPNNYERYGVSVIVGAAAGNLLDRVRYGQVTDFLEFDFVSFPIFNVADALIDLGALLIIMGALAKNKPREQIEQDNNLK